MIKKRDGWREGGREGGRRRKAGRKGSRTSAARGSTLVLLPKVARRDTHLVLVPIVEARTRIESSLYNGVGPMRRNGKERENARKRYVAVAAGRGCYHGHGRCGGMAPLPSTSLAARLEERR